MLYDIKIISQKKSVEMIDFLISKIIEIEKNSYYEAKDTMIIKIFTCSKQISVFITTLKFS